MTVYELVFAAALALMGPREAHREFRAGELARAIGAAVGAGDEPAARLPRDAAVLLALELHETGLGRAAGAPRFGLVAARRRLAGQPLEAWAAAALATWRRGRAACGSDEGAAFWFHSGRCVARLRGHSRAFRRAGRVARPYARRVVATVTRLAARPPPAAW